MDVLAEGWIVQVTAIGQYRIGRLHKEEWLFSIGVMAHFNRVIRIVTADAVNILNRKGLIGVINGQAYRIDNLNHGIHSAAIVLGWCRKALNCNTVIQAGIKTTCRATVQPSILLDEFNQKEGDHELRIWR